MAVASPTSALLLSSFVTITALSFNCQPGRMCQSPTLSLGSRQLLLASVSPVADSNSHTAMKTPVVKAYATAKAKAAQIG